MTLAPLPEETWETSVCLWWGDHWECLVDLWTRGEGRSGLVLELGVLKGDDVFEYVIHFVFVP
ncbi:DUF7668 domain-containing protein [Phycicoccus flavus]